MCPVDEKQWEELRRKAAEERNPFKLAVILSEIAAAARQEQHDVKCKAEPTVQKYRAKYAEKTAKRRRRRDATGEKNAPGEGAADRDAGRAGEKDPAESARFLELANHALQPENDKRVA